MIPAVERFFIAPPPAVSAENCGRFAPSRRLPGGRKSLENRDSAK
jgi:hypothetical protein